MKTAVLAHLYRVDVRPDQFHAQLIENTFLGQLDREVQAGLSADGRQQGIGPFLFDDRGQRFERKRFDVGLIGDLRIGHDSRRIGIDQYDLEAILF